ncbi:MAG: 3-keto-5-aminohexanoate cleavage protein, partial [Deltaproteobacteria bacterium]|nr:3-keto-5-aminohexanoate cleavage protein [Deltaproteobacteria bacterium]
FGPIVGWMEPSVKHLVMMHEEAENRLGRGNFTWSVAAAGKWQMPLAATAMAMGAPNIRVGLRGKMAQSSGDQVKMAVNIARELSLEPATPDEAREILGLEV